MLPHDIQDLITLAVIAIQILLAVACWYVANRVEICIRRKYAQRHPLVLKAFVVLGRASVAGAYYVLGNLIMGC